MAEFGGPVRTIPRDLAESDFAAWTDPTGLLLGLPTPEVNYQEQAYNPFGAPQTREALANIRSQGPSPGDLKSRAAMDKQARALFLRGQTAASPVATTQALAGGTDAQRAAIMAGARQRAMEEQHKDQAIMNALESEKNRQFAASRAENRRRYGQETVERKLFTDASEQDWDRMSKQLALAAQLSGNEHLMAASRVSTQPSPTEQITQDKPGLWGPELDPYATIWPRQPVQPGAR